MKQIFFILLLLCQISILYSLAHDTPTEKVQDSSKLWCWSKPSNNWDQNPANGGINWGYCQDPSNGVRLEDIKLEYLIIVQGTALKTSESKEKFSIILKGDMGQTEALSLTDQGFEQGSRYTKTVKGRKVGDIHTVRLISTTTKPYQCRTITVEIEHTFWVFDCNSQLKCPKQCTADYTIRGSQRYETTISTSDISGSGDSAPIYIQFKGDTTISPKVVLSETGFKTSDKQHKVVHTVDVGQIKCIILSSETCVLWRPETIVVKRAGEGNDVFEAKGEAIKCPQKSYLQLCNGAEDPGQDETQESSGGALSSTELTELRIAECGDVVKDNPLFGSKYAVKNVNSKRVLVKCPSNCQSEQDAKVYGTGIHPEESSICMSAIVDRSVPITGGVIGIEVVNGLPNYQEMEETNGIEVLKFGNSMKSFFTFKVDNIDFVSADMRIVDNLGELASEGRIEIRINGVWGTINSKGMNDYAARTICRQLSFNDGLLISNEENREICMQHNNQDYCGPNPTPIYFQDIQCTQLDTDVMQCMRSINEGGTHNTDAIIKCTNENFDNRQEIVAGTLRLMNDKNGVAEFKGGRLEIYHNKKWGSICNAKFTQNEANVACRQMGFDEGKFIGLKGNTEECLVFNGNNHCGPENQEIHAIASECEGNEKKFKDCYINYDTSKCNHMMDTIIQCEGDGDASGQSQQPDPGVAPPPSLGMLPLPPVQQLDCQSDFRDQKFQGDVGSVFVVQCPAQCADKVGSIWGTGIYTDDSSICRAGLHSGTIKNDGGLALVIRKPPLLYYVASEKTGIFSLEMKDSASTSFCVTVPSSTHERMASEWDKAKFAQGHEKQEELQEQNESFIQMKSKIKHNTNDIHITEPQLQWFPPDPLFSLDGKQNKIHTDGLKNIENSGSALNNDFVVMAQVTLKEFNKQQMQIIGHSGCGCYALYIDVNSEVVFDQRCTGPSFRTGYTMPLEIATAITFKYDEGATLLTFMASNFEADGAWKDWYTLETHIKFDFKCEKTFDIGWYQEGGNDFWDGTIDYVKIYNQLISNDEIYHLMQELFRNREYMTMGASAHPSLLVKKGTMYTSDFRQCVSTCTANPQPGTEGAEDAPDDVLPGIPSGKATPGSIKDGITSEEVERLGYKFKQTLDNKGEEKQNPEDPEIIPILNDICQIKGDMYPGVTGKKFKITCPIGCGQKPGNVIGSMVYLDESVICKSAIHAGYYEDSLGGDVIFEITNGILSYSSLFLNGIHSISFDHGRRSIVFRSNEDEGQVISCSDTADMEKFNGDVGTRYDVICPENCSKQETMIIFGNSYYSDDSQICLAAIHFGVLTNLGGLVKFRISGEQHHFQSTNGHGVLSEEKGAYIRSFEFLGHKITDSVYFKEEYSEQNISVHWEPWANPSADSDIKEWSYDPSPKDRLQMTIHQSKLIDVDHDLKYIYGTHLINNDYEGTNGILKISVLFRKQLKKEYKTGILLRRSSPESYLTLDIGQTLDLVSVQDGSPQMLESVKGISFTKSVWNHFRIEMKDDQIQVYLAQDYLRNMALVLTAKDEAFKRGQVGFALGQNDFTYFDMFSIQETNENQKEKTFPIDNMLNMDKCISDNSPVMLKKKCEEQFGGFDAYHKKMFVDDCTNFHKFCEICCASVIDPLDNIRNYHCQQKCQLASRIQDPHWLNFVANKHKDPSKGFKKNQN